MSMPPKVGPAEPPPAVSIIPPTFNAGRFIGETIRSVQAQTYREWEMLIADDCSTDDTRAVVEAFATRDPRIVLIRQPRQQGPARARKAALARARGRYICFLDSDDLWLPEKLHRQLAFTERMSCALSYTAYRRISQDGSVIGRLIRVPERLTYRQLLKNTAIATLTTMVDRDRTGPLQMVDEGYDEFILWLSMLRRGFRAFGLQEDLARYRAVGGSVSSRPLRSARWVWHVYREVKHLGFLGDQASRCSMRGQAFANPSVSAGIPFQRSGVLRVPPGILSLLP